MKVETKNLILIQAAGRRHGNTDLLADEFVHGAENAGVKVEKVYVADKNIRGCLGCMGCRRNSGVCVQKDDMQDIYPKLLNADIVVMSSPVYFYNVNAQLKAVMDRTFAIEPTWKGKEFWLVSTGMAPDVKWMETMIRNFKEYISCFEGSHFCGIVSGHGTGNKGDICGTDYMHRAYEAGLNILKTEQEQQ